MAYSESLLYAGYQDLNLTQIFMSGIFIGASGAMMDLAVDITSAVNEVIEKKPDISWREAARSGMNGNNDNHSSSGIFRGIHCPSYDFYGAGNPH